MCAACVADSDLSVVPTPQVRTLPTLARLGSRTVLLPMRRPSAPLASIDYNMTHHIPAPAFAVCSPSGPIPTVQPRLLTPDMALHALCNGVAHAHAVTTHTRLG